MTTYLGKSCSFCLPRVPFVNCRQFMYLVISLLVLRAGYGIWLYQFLIIAYLFTLHVSTCIKSWKNCIKSDFKEISFKLVANDWSDKRFCWHQNFVPWGCLPLTCGCIHLLNHEKMCIKSEVEGILCKLAIRWAIQDQWSSGYSYQRNYKMRDWESLRVLVLGYDILIWMKPV